MKERGKFQTKNFGQNWNEVQLVPL